MLYIQGKLSTANKKSINYNDVYFCSFYNLNPISILKWIFSRLQSASTLMAHEATHQTKKTCATRFSVSCCLVFPKYSTYTKPLCSLRLIWLSIQRPTCHTEFTPPLLSCPAYLKSLTPIQCQEEHNVANNIQGKWSAADTKSYLNSFSTTSSLRCLEKPTAWTTRRCSSFISYIL